MNAGLSKLVLTYFDTGGESYALFQLGLTSQRMSMKAGLTAIRLKDD